MPPQRNVTLRGLLLLLVGVATTVLLPQVPVAAMAQGLPWGTAPTSTGPIHLARPGAVCCFLPAPAVSTGRRGVVAPIPSHPRFSPAPRGHCTRPVPPIHCLPPDAEDSGGGAEGKQEQEEGRVAGAEAPRDPGLANTDATRHSAARGLPPPLPPQPMPPTPPPTAMPSSPPDMGSARAVRAPPDGSIHFPHTDREVAERLPVQRRVYLDNKNLLLKAVQLKCMLLALTVYLPASWIQLTGQFELFKGIATFDEPLFLSDGLMYFLDHRSVFHLFRRHFFRNLELASATSSSSSSSSFSLDSATTDSTVAEPGRMGLGDGGASSASSSSSIHPEPRAHVPGGRPPSIWPPVPEGLVVPCLLSAIQEFTEDIVHIPIHSSDHVFLTAWRARTVDKYREILHKLEPLYQRIGFAGYQDSAICAELLAQGALAVAGHALDPLYAVTTASLSKMPYEAGDEAFYHSHLRMDLLYDAMLADLLQAGLFTPHLHHQFAFHPPSLPVLVNGGDGEGEGHAYYYDDAAVRATIDLRPHFPEWEVEVRLRCFHEVIRMYLVLLDHMEERKFVRRPEHRRYIRRLVEEQTYAMELIAGMVGAVLPAGNGQVQQCVTHISRVLETELPPIRIRDLLHLRVADGGVGDDGENGEGEQPEAP